MDEKSHIDDPAQAVHVTKTLVAYWGIRWPFLDKKASSVIFKLGYTM